MELNLGVAVGLDSVSDRAHVAIPLFNDMTDTQNVAILGGAGSGKTEIAHRLAEDAFIGGAHVLVLSSTGGSEYGDLVRGMDSVDAVRIEAASLADLGKGLLAANHSRLVVADGEGVAPGSQLIEEALLMGWFWLTSATTGPKVLLLDAVLASEARPGAASLVTELLRRSRPVGASVVVVGDDAGWPEELRWNTTAPSGGVGNTIYLRSYSTKRLLNAEHVRYLDSGEPGAFVLCDGRRRYVACQGIPSRPCHV